MNTTVLTRYNYGLDLKTFFDYCVSEDGIFSGMPISAIALMDMENITSKDIERYLNYLNGYISPNGQYLQNKDRAKARKFCAVRSLFKYLYTHDSLKENVTLKVPMPKIRDKEIIRLSDAEVTDVINLAENDKCFYSETMNTYNDNNTKIRDMAILTLMLGTGIRVSECVGLNIKDFDFSNKSFTVTRKGDKVSILYFSDEVEDSLKKYLSFRTKYLLDKMISPASIDAFFISTQNKRISVRAVEILVKKYATVVSPLKKISPHKLRSTYGTALYRATKDIYVVAEVLGHKDLNTTKKHYAAISEDIKKSAADKVKLNKKED